MPILPLFFFSGVTALIYEVIWSDYLTLIFGSTIQAQTVVLAVFMGGLALGNKLFGGHADRARRPLVIYGGIEIAIGLYAIFFSAIYRLANGIFIPAGSRLLDHHVWLLCLNGLLSALLLLGPTILMGGTLPVLAAWLQKNTADSGRLAARFYSINTLGAVCGAWLAGFLLVEWLGLRRTTEAAAVVNLLVGFIAVNLGRKPAAANQEPAPSAGQGRLTPAATSPTISKIFRWSCVLVALTGAVSMGLEILASRCMALIFGASLQSFSIVLISFILGIGLGSAVISSPRFRRLPKEITTILLLLGTSALIGLLVFHIEKLAAVYLQAQSGLGRTPMGYDFHEILAAAISICVLGLPAAMLGSVLPLWIRAVPEDSDLLGDHVGRLVTWNTLGAVAGVLLTGFVLMPHIGMRNSFAVIGLLLAVAAIITALSLRRRIAAVAGIAVGALVLMATVSGDAEWRAVFSIGIFRMPDMDVTQNKTLSSYMEGWHKVVTLLFYKDGADATVSVERVKSASTNNLFILRIDGKPEASASDGAASGDLAAQVMVAQLPLMAKPDSRDVFCFGMGSGITAWSALGYPIEHLTVAENCAPVLRAAEFFTPWNHGVMTNDRVRIYREDARTVLKLGPQKYDVIISEPSNPWLIGIGRVFSREFYQLAASRLKPGGVMGQWFHLYEMDDKTLDVVLRTFGSVFPNMEIWDVGDKDIVLIGSAQPLKTGLEACRHVFELAGPSRDLAMLGLLTPQELLARQFASQRTAFALAGPGSIESDNFPLLEYEAPRAFYMYQNRQGVQQMENYDERTWQMGLAAPDKNKTVAALSLAELHQIFGSSFGSGNPQLQSYLENRFQGHVGSMVFDNRIMPCVFEDTNAAIVVYAAPSAATNIVARQLYYAELALRTNPQESPKAVQIIGQILDGMKSYNPQETEWSPAYYADLAVKTNLRLGNAAGAKAILLRGLQLEPDSDELNYLARILIREGILQPSEVPTAAKSGLSETR